MACYKDLAGMLRDKGYADELADCQEWAFAMLEESDKESYRQIVDKMECLAYKIDRHDAEKIVKAMRPRGEYWSYDTVVSVLPSGALDRAVEYYLVMNMAYNDYYNTAEQFGLSDNTDFYYGIAHDFIEDVDGKPYKVAKYFMM